MVSRKLYDAFAMEVQEMTTKEMNGAAPEVREQPHVQAYSLPSLKPRDSKPAVSIARDSAPVKRLLIQYACAGDGSRWTTDTCKGPDGFAFRFNVPFVVEQHPRYGKIESIDRDNCPLYHQRAGESTWAVHCPQCDRPAAEGNRRIRGSHGKTACESFCETATSSTCACSCGGINHGVRS